MTDFFEMIEGIRSRTERKCAAQGCAKRPDGKFFCCKHWNYLGREVRSNLHHGTDEMREAALERAKEIIAKCESRGRDA